MLCKLSGTLSQMVGPAMLKELSWARDMLTLMTGNLFTDFDCRGWPWFTTKRSFRYWEAFPLRHRKTMIPILYSILWCILSQQRPCMSSNMWSYLCLQTTMQHAIFCTFCNFAFGGLYNTLSQRHVEANLIWYVLISTVSSASNVEGVTVNCSCIQRQYHPPCIPSREGDVLVAIWCLLLCSSVILLPYPHLSDGTKVTVMQIYVLMEVIKFVTHWPSILCQKALGVYHLISVCYLKLHEPESQGIPVQFEVLSDGLLLWYVSFWTCSSQPLISYRVGQSVVYVCLGILTKILFVKRREDLIPSR